MRALFRWLWRGLRALFGLGPNKRKRLPKAPSRSAKPSMRDFVRVAYQPSRDGEPDPGEVVWTWVAFEEDPSQGKDRPVLLIGFRRNALVGVALTSKRHEHTAQYELGAGPWDSQGRDSYVKLDRLIEVDPARVRREGAVVPRSTFNAVIAALKQTLPESFGA